MSRSKVCNHCGGSGYVMSDSLFGPYKRKEHQKCPVCRGHGFVHEDIDKSRNTNNRKKR